MGTQFELHGVRPFLEAKIVSIGYAQKKKAYDEKNNERVK